MKTPEEEKILVTKEYIQVFHELHQVCASAESAYEILEKLCDEPGFQDLKKVIPGLNRVKNKLTETLKRADNLKDRPKFLYLNENEDT